MTMKTARGLLLVNTGNGKGKSTAAFGVAFRAIGHGLSVSIIQFIKGKWKTGEGAFAEKLPELTFLIMGRGFTWESDDLSRDKAAARVAWEKAAAMIAAGEHSIVVLDELTYVINYDFVGVEEVLAVLRARPEHVHVVVTGRNAPDELVEMADLVTEMRSVKHPFEKGVPAQPGIDF